MKYLFLLIPALFLLTACPIGLDYAPGKEGTEKVNSDLEGTWKYQGAGGGADAEVLSVTFKKKDKYSFLVTVLEVGEMYSIETKEFIGYETKIEGLNILYFKPTSGTDQKYYLYQYTLSKGEFTIADISLKVGGVDAVTSTDALRTEIAASMKHPEFYSSPKVYKK